MITENAKVISIENDITWVETKRKSVCGQCSANKGCGTSVLSKVLGNKLATMKVINNVDAKEGDDVIVALNESSMLKGAFMTYIVPLLYLFVFSVIGNIVAEFFTIQNNEVVVIIFSIIGFYMGLQKLKAFSKLIASDENYQPTILKKSNPVTPVVDF